MPFSFRDGQREKAIKQKPTCIYIYKPFRPSFGDPCREVYVMDGQLFALAFKSELAIVAFCVP